MSHTLREANLAFQLLMVDNLESKELLCSPTPKVHGYDFSYQGLLGIWDGFPPDSPPDSVEDTPTAVNRSLLLDVPSSASGPNDKNKRQRSARRSDSPADDMHGNWPAAMATLADRRGVERSLWKPLVPTTKLLQRQVALHLCGWNLKDDEWRAAIKR